MSQRDYMQKYLRTSRAFTIIEVVVVVAILGILIAVSIVAYGEWQKNAIHTSIKANLTSAASAMETARNMGSGYPSTLPSNFTPTDGVVITVFSATQDTYCLNGSNAAVAETFYIRSSTKNDGATTGTCS